MKYKNLEKNITKKEKEDFKSKIEKEVPDSILSYLINREYSPEEFNSLFKKVVLLDPLTIPGMKDFSERINKAIKNKDKVFIFGDYDVDGTMAVVIFVKYLKSIGVDVEHYIPEREDGYGLSKIAIEKIKKKKGNCIITVDTGISALEEASYAKELGIDLIITDHHNLHKDGLPDSFLNINPKIKGMPKEIYNLSGAGVALYLCRGVNLFRGNKDSEMKDYFVLATVSSIADVVALRGENRYIVQIGLKYLEKTEIIGLNCLLKACNFFNKPTSTDIAFKISPILNAAGRLGQAKKTMDLFFEENYLKANNIASELLSLNEKRKELTKEFSEKAILEAEKVEDKVVILNGDYPLGIIGILAAKVLEKTGKPTIIMSVKDGIAKGSCRSKVLNFKEILDNTSDIHLGGGGHNVAAGFTINEGKIDEFKTKVRELVLNKKFEDPVYSYDAELTVDDLTGELAFFLEKLEPYGEKNHKPVFLIKNIPIKNVKLMKEIHIRYNFRQDVDLLKFFASEEELNNIDNNQISVYAKLALVGGKIQILADKVL